MPTTINGHDCKIYHGTAGSTAATLLQYVRDATTNNGTVEADVSVRGYDDRLTDVTKLDRSITFDLLYVPADTGWQALNTAYQTRAAIALLILDGLKATIGSRGVDADFKITNFTRGESLDGKVIYSVTAKPTLSSRAPAEWVMS